MDDLNYKIVLSMQKAAQDVWQSVAPLLPYGSYTASQVYDYFSKDSRGKEKSFKDIMDGLDKVCHQEITINVENFKCTTPKYLFFKILHKFEQLAGISSKNKKKFVREADSGKESDVSFIVEIKKPMLSLVKSACGKKETLRPVLQRVALDYVNGCVVATNGRILSVQSAVYRDKLIKECASELPILVSPDIFKKFSGDTRVFSCEKDKMATKYSYSASDGSYYEEDAVGRFPNWKSVLPKDLFLSGRVTLSKEGMKQLLNVAKLADKKADCESDGKNLIFQTNGNKLILSYFVEEKMQSSVILLDEEPASFTICIDPKFFSLISGWNGTMWVSGYSKPIIFDGELTENFHLVMPRALPDSIPVKEAFNGATIAFNCRYKEYVKQPQKQRTETKKKQTEFQTETKNNNPIIQIFMAAERYEGTEAFYSLEQIENGEFRVKGNKHDSDLVLFLRTAAHYIRRQGQTMQSEFCAYCSKQMEGKDWRSLVPMEELALAEMFEGFLAAKGIDDIPDVEFEDIIEEAETEAEPQGRATIDIEPIEEEVEEVIEAEVEEIVDEEPEVSVKPMAIEREIVPTLELETTEGTLIIAGESYLDKLYDEENECFRSPQAEAKFNQIDAFIADELITADELDYAAITDAVVEFMEAVEQAS